MWCGKKVCADRCWPCLHIGTTCRRPLSSCAQIAGWASRWAPVPTFHASSRTSTARQKMVLQVHYCYRRTLMLLHAGTARRLPLPSRGKFAHWASPACPSAPTSHALSRTSTARQIILHLPMPTSMPLSVISEEMERERGRMLGAARMCALTIDGPSMKK